MIFSCKIVSLAHRKPLWDNTQEKTTFKCNNGKRRASMNARGCQKKLVTVYPNLDLNVMPHTKETKESTKFLSCASQSNLRKKEESTIMQLNKASLLVAHAGDIY